MSSNTAPKTRLLVLFGGPTVEHEVSVVTALGVLGALDPRRFEALPLYWAPDGNFYTGAALGERKNYPFTESIRKQCTRAVLPLGRREVATGRPVLRLLKEGFFKSAEDWAFDCVLPVAHGSMVEDGAMQGVYTALGAPFVGPGVMAASLFMNKWATKQLLASQGVPVLPSVLVQRPRTGFVDAAEMARALDLPFDYPVIVKPNHLGSSVGVSRANHNNLAEALAQVFRFDTAAIIEPCVAPLVEYNVSVTRAFDDSVRVSAIEQPLAQGETLDFAKKYHGDGAKKGGAKKAGNGAPVRGMAWARRMIEPDSLTAAQRQVIVDSARTAMLATGAKGAPRIDFIANGDTGEIWLNEVNSMPGDFAYFLWELADQAVTFTELLTALVEEALRVHKAEARAHDPVQAGAVMFRK